MSRNCHGDCLLGKATQPARAQSLNLGNGHVISTKNNWCDTPYFWPQNQWQLFWSGELLSTTIAIQLHFHYLGSEAIHCCGSIERVFASLVRFNHNDLTELELIVKTRHFVQFKLYFYWCLKQVQCLHTFAIISSICVYK